METHTHIKQTIIAARVPASFKHRVDTYAEDNDLSVSQLIRTSLKETMGRRVNDATMSVGQ